MSTALSPQKLGPDHARLTVRTGKTGAAAKAGHNLVIEVTSWEATIASADASDALTITLTVDARSLRVREDSGGIQALGDDDMANIDQTIDDEVLKGGTIAFRSTRVDIGADGLQVEGELDLLGRRRPLAFALARDAGGGLTGSVRFKQTDWGIKPYSALFGTLKVADEVEVVVDVPDPS